MTRPPSGRRVVLHRAETEGEAELWAGAFRTVLSALDISPWWTVHVDPADRGALLVSVDYAPGHAPRRRFRRPR
ncbi:MAG: hypothetical protein ACRDPY_34270 [Streptosporangiaceae bacterium]